LSDSITEIITIISLIVGILGTLVSIITFLRTIKWRVFFFKYRLRKTLIKYKRNIFNEKKERKYIIRLGNLIDKVLKRVKILDKLGFQSFGKRGIGDKKFRLYFKGRFKFTIKDLGKSQPFFSKQFEEATLKQSVDEVIFDFLKYLKEKK